MTSRQPIGETRYALAYGVKVLIPIEAEIDVLRTSDPTELSLSFNELEERREIVATRMAEY